MSKILRRPMFRGGGKVSSYGNGIATGLADGGMASKRGLVDGPGGYSGKDDFIPIAPQAIKDARNMGTLMTPEYLNNKFRKNYYLDSGVGYRGTGMPIKGMQGMIDIEDEFNLDGQPIIDEGSVMDITRDQIITDPRAEEFYRNKFIEDKYQSSIDRQQKALEAVGDKDSLAKLLGDVDTPEKTTTKTEAEIRAEIAQEYKDKFRSKKLTEGEELAALEKEQAFFEKLLGGGKAAMIDDLSTMGLNYASGALKEGATVKSSFADFFEKEAKRPSRRMKVKDAATQAAIQSYLTGKTSLQKFQNDLDGYSTKLEMKDKFDKKDLSIDNVLRAEAGNNGKVTNEGVMARSFDRIYKDVPGYAKFQGEVKPDKELIEGGIYYVTEGNDRIVYIVKNGKLEEIKTIFN